MVFRFTSILFFVKNELSFCCRFIMERKRKNEVNKRRANQSAKQCTAASRAFKCTLQSLSELRGMPDVKTYHKHEV